MRCLTEARVLAAMAVATEGLIVQGLLGPQTVAAAAVVLREVASRVAMVVLAAS